MSKRTAVKIRDLHTEGKLAFLFEYSQEEETVRQASEVAAVGYTVSRVASLPFDPSARWQKLLPTIPVVDWSVGALESEGIPAEVGLELLVELDELLWALDAGKATKSDLLRCVQLHYIASFVARQAERRQPAPYNLVALAALYSAKGKVHHNKGLTKLGEDVLRYEVWRGQAFVKAFERAYNVDKRHQRLLKTISAEAAQAAGLQHDGGGDGSGEEQ